MKIKKYEDFPLIPQGDKVRVFVYKRPVTMSASFPMLSALTMQQVRTDVLPYNALFVFTNEKQTYAKILYQTPSGPCILAKRLEQGSFDLRLGNNTLTVKGLTHVFSKPVTEKSKK